MQIKSIKTHKITEDDKSIFEILDKYITTLSENSIVVVTSKVVSICEGRIIPIDKMSKDELVKSEAEKYLPKETNTFNITVTIKNNILAVNAGIDESNTNGKYVLWPEDTQKSANSIRHFLKNKFKLKNIGVLITDSKTTPLRYGITGIGLACSGFLAINPHVGEPDIFGHILKMTNVNVMDGLASAAAVLMGESSEQTPLAIITEAPFVKFQDRNPTDDELKLLEIDLDTDVYGEILKSVPWKKGGK